MYLHHHENLESPSTFLNENDRITMAVGFSRMDRLIVAYLKVLF
jgi:hypothetical protein